MPFSENQSKIDLSVIYAFLLLFFLIRTPKAIFSLPLDRFIKVELYSEEHSV